MKIFHSQNKASTSKANSNQSFFLENEKDKNHFSTSQATSLKPPPLFIGRSQAIQKKLAIPENFEEKKTDNEGDQNVNLPKIVPTKQDNTLVNLPVGDIKGIRDSDAPGLWERYYKWYTKREKESGTESAENPWLDLEDENPVPWGKFAVPLEDPTLLEKYVWNRGGIDFNELSKNEVGYYYYAYRDGKCGRYVGNKDGLPYTVKPTGFIKSKMNKGELRNIDPTTIPKK